jgi:hypothetical protein
MDPAHRERGSFSSLPKVFGPSISRNAYNARARVGVAHYFAAGSAAGDMIDCVIPWSLALIGDQEIAGVNETRIVFRVLLDANCSVVEVLPI